MNNIIASMANILLAYAYVYIYKNLTNDETNVDNVKTMLYVLLIAALMYVNNYYYNVIFFIKLMFSTLLLIMLFKLVFKEHNCKDITYYGILISLVSIILDLLLSIIVVFFVKDIYSLSFYPIFKLVFSIFYTYIIYIFFKIPKIKKHVNGFKKTVTDNIKYIGYMILILFIVNVLYSMYVLDFADIKYYIILVVVIVLMILFSYIYFNTIYNNKLLNIKNQYLEENVNNYQQSLENYRLLKHNLINDLLILKSSEINSYNKVIDEIIKKYNKNTEWINNLNNIPIGIQGIIYSKISYAKSQNIEVYIDNTINKAPNNTKKYIEICEILGICLDNAIEATSLCKDKKVYINMMESENDYVIEIINSYNNDIDLNQIGNKNYSTKKRNSGVGLNYVEGLDKKIKINKYIIKDLFKIVIVANKK